MSFDGIISRMWKINGRENKFIASKYTSLFFFFLIYFRVNLMKKFSSIIIFHKMMTYIKKDYLGADSELLLFFFKKLLFIYFENVKV